MTTKPNYAAMSDPNRNPQFRRAWTEKPKPIRFAREERDRGKTDGRNARD